MRRDDTGVWETASQLRHDCTLVRRVAVCVQQTHGNRVRVEVRKRAEVERLELALRADATANAVAALERDERLRPVRARTVELGPRLSPQMKEVLEPGIRDERRSRALPLE